MGIENAHPRRAQKTQKFTRRWERFLFLCIFVFFAASLPSLSAPASFAVGSGVPIAIFEIFALFGGRGSVSA
jgi:hypothetical protein